MNIEKYKQDMEKLVDKGNMLYFALVFEQYPKQKEETKKKNNNLVEKVEKEIGQFSEKYQQWYSEALEVLRQVLPSRESDFVGYYKPAKNRKKDDINNESYTISDCLNGLNITHGFEKEKVVGPDAAIPKLRQQLKIIEALKRKFESSLFDIRALLQSDLFDNELEAADELNKKGFFRAAGSLAGVVLESHLKEICFKHSISIRKTKPTIADFNDALKNTDVIDIPVWRNIQFLADIRNLCDHKKEKEPKKEEIEDLIMGVRKISKTVF